MQNGNWGHCKTCKHFGSPAARPLGAEEASCHAPALERFATESDDLALTARLGAVLHTARRIVAAMGLEVR